MVSFHGNVHQNEFIMQGDSGALQLAGFQEIDDGIIRIQQRKMQFGTVFADKDGTLRIGSRILRSVESGIANRANIPERTASVMLDLQGAATATRTVYRKFDEDSMFPIDACTLQSERKFILEIGRVDFIAGRQPQTVIPIPHHLFRERKRKLLNAATVPIQKQNSRTLSHGNSPV